MMDDKDPEPEVAGLDDTNKLIYTEVEGLVLKIKANCGHVGMPPSTTIFLA